jgi:hypothetical protein
MWRSPLLRRSRPPALVLGLLAVLCCGAALAAVPRGLQSRPFGAVGVNARRAPGYGLLPISRRDDAVLWSQPEVQLLGVGTTAGRSKLARLPRDRIRRPAAGVVRRGAGAGGDRYPARPSTATAVRLRAPPSPV